MFKSEASNSAVMTETSSIWRGKGDGGSSDAMCTSCNDVKAPVSAMCDAGYGSVDERSDGVGGKRYSVTEDSVEDRGSLVPDGGWGWLVTVAAFVLMYVAAIPCVGFGILFSSFLLEQRASATTTAWIFNLALINSGFFSYFVGPLVDELGWRRVGFVSSIAFGAGMILSAFATSPGFLILSFSIIVGSNIEILMNIAYMVIPHYFTHWRNVANSLMTSGISISQMIMAPAITYLQEEYGFKGAMLITGAIFLNGCVASMVLHPVEWHGNKKKKESGAPSVESPTDECSMAGKRSKTGRRLNAGKTSAAGKTSVSSKVSEVSGTSEARRTLMDGENLETGRTLEACRTIKAPGIIVCLRRILRVAVQNLHYLKSPVIVLTATVLGMLYTVLYNIFTLVPFAMQFDGFTQREASFCLFVSGVCNIVSRLLTSFLSCCPGIKVRPLYLLGSFLTGIGVIAFSLAGTLTGKAVAMAVCGVGYGVAASLYNLYIVEELGLVMLIPTLGIASFLTGVLYLVLGPITGVVQDLSGSYVVTLCFCSSCLLFSVVLGFLIPAARALEQRRKQGSAEGQDKEQDNNFKQERRTKKEDLAQDINFKQESSTEKQDLAQDINVKQEQNAGEEGRPQDINFKQERKSDKQGRLQDRNRGGRETGKDTETQM